MINIYDCSNSPESHHGVDYGPKENDVIKGLKEYSRLFGCKFVSKPSMANIIITNDIFPEEIKKLDAPKIKRMDGIYWENLTKHKNIQLNESAEIADHVIFISEYSKIALRTLYPDVVIKDSSVILNTADNKIFKNNARWSHPSEHIIKRFIASCTNWNRKEKRFDSLMELAKMIPETLYLVGECEMEVPANVIKLGYISDYEQMSKILQESDAYINLSYRDAAPKLVCQAVACGLPILYADSGGLSEIVKYGFSIKDEKEIFFADDVAQLNTNDILQSYNELKKYPKNKISDVNTNYLAMITNYYKIITSYGNREKILD